MDARYNPCFVCLTKYNRQYTESCDDTCDYAHAIKVKENIIENLFKELDSKDTELREEKSRVANLIARNARLDYDLGRAYQLICKLKGDD